MNSLKRYEVLKDSFMGKLICNDNEINLNRNNINLINGEIPNFIDSKLDEITNKMSNFYNDVKFPNYEDFDDYASLYDKGISNSFTNRLDQEINYGIKILELGCGTGQLSLFLARGNREVYGVDISEGSLLLGENFRKNNKIEKAFFMKMDVFDLKFKENNFDFTISNGVLHHTKDAKKAFKELVKVTKPKGFIVIGLYHKYGRFFTKIKQKIAKFIGKKVFFLDQNSLRIKSKEKRDSWVTDQFLNPHETLHTPLETLKWFEEEKVEFINLIPQCDNENLEILAKRPKPILSKIEEILMMFNSKQIEEGGFFVIIGRKQ